ncbi:MAG: universal stress protein [Clostridiales bacterium]|nr:universal stress protein [Candidatus Crickella equi]
MRKIVLPLVETERSLLALQYVKKHFSPTQAEIIIVMVDESLAISATRDDEAAAQAVIDQKLELIAKVLDGYQVVTKGYVGKAGPCIVKTAREYNADYIVMTKSAQPDMLSMVGRTTDYVLNNAYCNVLIVSENKLNAGEYKGLIYKKASAVVNLRGQIGDKQSECLLPSVDADCNYHFEVTVGKIRFFHTAYNPETSNWDMPPSGDQIASIDVAAGETADLLVKANSVDGKADRIRIINRGMKQEAVFSYKITAAEAPEPLDIPDAPGAMPAPAVINLESGEVVSEAEPVAEELAMGLEALAEEPVVVEEPVVEERFGLPEEETEYIIEEPTIEIPSVVKEPTIELAESEIEDLVKELESEIPEDVFEVLEDIAEEEIDPGVEEAVEVAEVDPAFEDLFEEMPSPEPIDEVSVATLQHDFDEIINEFRTGQMNYIVEEPDYLSDLEEYKEPEDQYE